MSKLEGRKGICYLLYQWVSMCNHCFSSLLLLRAIKMWKAGIKPGVRACLNTHLALFYIILLGSSNKNVIWQDVVNLRHPISIKIMNYNLCRSKPVTKPFFSFGTDVIISLLSKLDLKQHEQ